MTILTPYFRSLFQAPDYNNTSLHNWRASLHCVTIEINLGAFELKKVTVTLCACDMPKAHFH